MKNNDIKLEKCRFIGDSNLNKAIYTDNDGETVECTQTKFIKALTQSEKYIKGGKKLNLGKDSERISYLIDYGNKVSYPQEMIKVTFDKKNLYNGDANAIAIDSICKNAIKINKNNIKKKVLIGTALVLVTSAVLGVTAVGLDYALKKEDEYQNGKIQEYMSDINQRRFENGLGPIGTEDSIDYDDLTFDFDNNENIKSR